VLRKSVLILAAVIGCSLMTQSACADMLTNGGFESGNLTGWIYTEAQSKSPFYITGMFGTHSGICAADFGAVGSSVDSISQTVQTDVGANYVLDFWLRQDGNGNDNSFTASWNGVPLLSLTNADTFGWTEFKYEFVGAATTSTLTFSGRNRSSFFLLDDVTLVDPPGTPEPSAVVGLLGMGGVGLAGLVWRRRKRG
jgi:hypothetical protein